MKTLMFLALMSLVACEEKPNIPEVTSGAVAKPVAEEDCDDKAKAAQKVEIKEDSISLSNGSTGCTLDEAQK